MIDTRVKNILITGANGFVASYLSSVLSHEMRLVGICRNGRPLENFQAVYTGTLGKPLENVFEQEQPFDFIIHCANSTGENEYELNFIGTITWAQQGIDSGVQNQIFISSISSLGDSPSEYGRAKKDLEDWFFKKNLIVLRLGLVIGPGGLFSRMVNLIKKSPIIPLIDGGKSLIHFVDISTVSQVLLEILMNSTLYQNQAFNIQYSQPKSLKKILTLLCQKSNKFCYFIPIPFSLVFFLMKINEKIPNSPLKITTSNLIGLRKNNNIRPKSDLETFKIKEKSIDAIIEESLNFRPLDSKT